MANFFDAFPEAAYTLNDLFFAGDKGVWRGTWHATQRKQWEGIPATGRKAKWTVIIIGRFEGESGGRLGRIRPVRSVSAARRALTLMRCTLDHTGRFQVSVASPAPVATWRTYIGRRPKRRPKAPCEFAITKPQLLRIRFNDPKGPRALQEPVDRCQSARPGKRDVKRKQFREKTVGLLYADHRYQSGNWPWTIQTYDHVGLKCGLISTH